MSVKIWPFTNPADYTYDSSKIEVVGGLTKLNQQPILSDVYAGWHLNELSGDIATDFSGNGRNGTLVNSPSWVAGKLSNCLQFAFYKIVNCGNIADFSIPFSVECWIKIDVVQQYACGIVSRVDVGKGWMIYIDNNSRPAFFVYGCSPNYIQKSSAISLGIWHHIVAIYTGISLELYVDNIKYSVAVIGSPISCPTNCKINQYGGTAYIGFVDEVIIYNKKLLESEVAYRYNLGNGRENFPINRYDSSKPLIQPATLFHADYMAQFNHFLQTLGAGNQGQVKYTLSTDGSIWRYWNGANWTTGGNENNCNTQTEIEAHIATFPLANDIIFRAYLISDGTQKVELDDNILDYIANQPPYVNAGADKVCSDHNTIAPFSDAVVYDLDGDTENAHAYYNIEGGGWIEISKGAATLQEAIRSFTYVFDNIGSITCQLKITDEIGSSTVDSAVVTVSKYIVSFTIKDEEGWNVPNLTVDFGDGSGWKLRSSPFSYAYDYGDYIVTIEKYGFKPIHLVLIPDVTPVVDLVTTLIGYWSKEELIDEISKFLQPKGY